MHRVHMRMIVKTKSKRVYWLLKSRSTCVEFSSQYINFNYHTYITANFLVFYLGHSIIKYSYEILWATSTLFFFSGLQTRSLVAWVPRERWPRVAGPAKTQLSRPLVPQLIIPIKTARNTRDPSIICETLECLKRRGSNRLLPKKEPGHGYAHQRYASSLGTAWIHIHSIS